MATTEIVVASLDKDERIALAALVAVYGDETDAVLNGIHTLAAKIAIMTGVEPQKFAAGMKHHWDAIAQIVNQKIN